MKYEEFSPQPPANTASSTPERSVFARVIEGLVVASALGLFLFLAVMGGFVVRNYMLRLTGENCRQNIRQLAMAVQLYHDAHGSFPPAYLADADGKPMHSWRVLLLPYLDDPVAQATYDNYRFGEPWNSAHNRTAAAVMPDVYRCSSDSKDSSKSRYLAVIGEETMWRGAVAVTSAHLHDGPADTICIVEAGETTVPWLEPRDISPPEFLAELTKPRHRQGTLAAMANGLVIWISPGADPKIVQALLTSAGKERVNRNEVTAN